MVTFDSTDLDNAASESGVVHESVVNTDHDNASELKQGYSISTPYLSTSIVGYWPLQEDSGSTSYDFSGNNNDGTASGAGPSGTGTRSHTLGTTGYVFDGTDDSVSIPDTAFDSFTTGSFTVAFWFQTSDSSDQCLIYPNGDADTRFDIGTFTTDRLTFQIFGGSSTVIGTTSSVSDGALHLAVGVYDSPNTEMELYLDGALEASALSVQPGSVSRGNVFGFDANNNNRYYNGSLGPVWAWSTDLSGSEVQSLYDVVATAGSLTTQYKSI